MSGHENACFLQFSLQPITCLLSKPAFFQHNGSQMKRLFSFTAAVFAFLLAFSPCTGSSCLSRTPRSSAFWGADAYTGSSADSGAAVISAYQGGISARFTSQRESDIQVVLNSSGKFRPSTRSRAGAPDALSKSGGWEGFSSSCITSHPISGALYPALSRFHRLTAWVQSVI